MSDDDWPKDGCICVIKDGQPYGFTQKEDGEIDWRIDPGCAYHQWAADHPGDHRSPWNCPTFWDGCNCDGGPFYGPFNV